MRVAAAIILAAVFVSPSGLRSFAFGAPARAYALASAATAFGSLGREPHPTVSVLRTHEGGGPEPAKVPFASLHPDVTLHLGKTADWV